MAGEKKTAVAHSDPANWRCRPWREAPEPTTLAGCLALGVLASGFLTHPWNGFGGGLDDGDGDENGDCAANRGRRRRARLTRACESAQRLAFPRVSEISSEIC